MKTKLFLFLGVATACLPVAPASQIEITGDSVVMPYADSSGYNDFDIVVRAGSNWKVSEAWNVRSLTVEEGGTITFDFSDSSKSSKVTVREGIYLAPGAAIKVDYDGQWYEQMGRSFLLFAIEPGGAGLYDYGAGVYSVDGMWKFGCRIYRSHADNYFYIVESIGMGQ